MSIMYAGGVNRNSLVAGDTAALITNNIQAELLAAGWTVGAGGAGDWRMDSAITPAGRQIRVRLLAAAPDCQIILSDVAEAILPAGQLGLLGEAPGRVFRVIANRYQFFAFTPGLYVTHTFAFASCFFVPPFLAVVHAALSGANHNGTIYTFRNAMYHHSQDFTWLWDMNGVHYNGGSAPGSLQLSFQGNPLAHANVGFRWHDNSFDAYDAVLVFGATAAVDEGKKAGLLWDAFVCSGDFPDGTFVTYDGKQFVNIGVSIVGAQRGTLFVYAP